MDGLRGFESIAREGLVFHHLHHLVKNDASAAGQRHGYDSILLVGKDGGFSYFGSIALQVRHCDDAFSALHFFDDEPGRFALIEPFSAEVTDPPQGTGKVFLYQGVACFPAACLYEDREDGVVSAESFLGIIEAARFGLCDGETILRQIDRRLHQPGEGKSRIVQFFEDTGDGTRNTRREMTVLTKIRAWTAILIEIHIACSRTRGFFAVVERDILSGCRMRNHETAAADVAGSGIDDGQYELGRDGCIECIAALAQDADSRMAGEGMSADDGAMCHECRLADVIGEWRLAFLGKQVDRRREKCAKGQKTDERLPHTEERFTVSYHFSYIRPFMNYRLLIARLLAGNRPTGGLWTRAGMSGLLMGLLLSVCCCTAQTVPSPEAFLGYRLGAHFTPYHLVTGYFRAVAGAAPDRVRIEQYGTTYEGRPLLLAFIASPANLQRMESVRRNNLRLAGVLRDSVTPDEHAPVIVWLSYNVHGNEPASTEAAMKTLYALADAASPQERDLLQHTVVVIDPCINPDGRDRYVNWYNDVVGVQPNPDPSSREHQEPWPRGRSNHYNFDLNRDWAWQTQIETQQRLKKYNAWLPQVHVDFHEQGFNNPYYFAPAAEPYHDVITPWQREFQVMVGKNNAHYFDRNGWLYFTKEEFDLFYPSYGDTYPIYNGAIGMTFEQGGIGAGLAVQLSDGDTLTLAQRIEHHFTTGISTIEAASTHAGELVRNFHAYFLAAIE